MEPLVTIAIPDLAGPTALAITLASIASHTPELHEVVLIVEESRGLHVPSRSANHSLQRIAVAAPFGIPAALNRLIAACTTPYILLLESGAIVTPGWLSCLLAPLNDPQIALSGPSTNACWNEQKVLARSGGISWSVQQINAYAAEVAERFSSQWLSLDTLHSLGDFCYLFKRSVAEQLGGFDEAYGAGPCWEIDFNTRVARAGFRAIWVAGAYVHRGPQSRWKVNSVRRHFTISKQLYQDRFCGLRLQGKKMDYEAHCRGEACEHFAPANLIQVTLQPGFRKQLSDAVNLQQGNFDNSSLTNNNDEAQPSIEGARSCLGGTRPGQDGCQVEVLSQATPPPTLAPVIISTPGLPLVSCIMPTRNRRTFVRQALAYFERQDYPNRELIIVDDGEDRVSDLVPSDACVRYIALSESTSIGAKRNIACEQAHGAIIAHWDDDDWYAPHRLRHQVLPLLDKKADMTGLETSCFFDLSHWQAWTCTPELHRRLFVGDVHGGTLVYWRYVWERMARYPAVSVAEDALFLRQACRQGAGLQKLPHANSFVYLRHDNNAWKFPLGSYLLPAGWKRADLMAFLPENDQPFYAALSPAAPASAEPYPLVSCIMPTFNRRLYVPQAIQYFLRQDYPNRELLILDDGTEPVGDLVPTDPSIRYIRLDNRLVLGAKRNLACEMAHGSIITHWDDDDWIAPHRLSYQIAILEQCKADLCGASQQLYYDPSTNKAWLYAYPPTTRRWLAGNTLCYRKGFWAKNPFPEIAIGEDTRFVWSSKASNAVMLPDYSFYIGVIHSSNTCRKQVTGRYWCPHPVESIYSLLGADLAFYRSTCGRGVSL